MTQAHPTSRIPALDQARSAALLAMAIYHFCFDLEMFGWLAPGTAVTQPLKGFAVAIASSFIALAGISLVLAHDRGIRWPAFRRRLFKVAGAALLVSVATYLWAPAIFIYFGILHAIALFSLLGLLVLRWPVWALIGAGLIAFFLPAWSRSPLLDPRWLAWTGLAEQPPPSLDFEPLFPWFAAFLAGMALARIGEQTGLWARLAGGSGGRLGPWLAWPGQHSLVIYLLHQPVLIGLIWAVSAVLR